MSKSLVLGTQQLRQVSPVLSWREGSPSSSRWQCSAWCTSGVCLPLLPGHRAAPQPQGTELPLPSSSPTRVSPASCSPQPALLQTIALVWCFNLLGNKGIISVLHPWCVCCETVPQMNFSLLTLRTGQAKRRFQLAIGKGFLMVRKVNWRKIVQSWKFCH